MKISFSGKIYGSTGLIVFLVFFSALYSMFMINKTQEFAEDTGSYWIPIIEKCQTVINSFSQLEINSINIIAEDNSDKRKTIVNSIDEQIKKITESKLKFDVLFINGNQKDLYSDFDNQWTQILEHSKLYLGLIKESKLSEARIVLNEKVIPSLTAAQKLFLNINDLSFSSGRESTRKGEVLNHYTKIVMICVLILALLSTILTIKVIQLATKKLINSIVVLKDESVLIGDTGNSLKKNADSFSENIQEQSEFVEQTAKLVDEIISIIKESILSTNESIAVIRSSSQEVGAGRKIMEDFVLAMNDIQESSMELKDIANIVVQINSKTVVINEIVSKTELLSLNASIESARAAEHGKGFAVVAEEVGNLAKVSGKAAFEIQLLINSSQERVQHIIKTTQEKIQTGKKITLQAKENFMKISENISSIQHAIEHILESTQKQKDGVDKIFTEVQLITKETEKNQSILVSNQKLAKILVEQSGKIEELANEIEFLIFATRKESYINN